MPGIYVERWSSAAIWCQRLAFFLIPFFLVVILLFRFDKIEITQLFALMGVGLVVALVGAIFGVRAVVDLWNRGDRGGSKVVRGLVAIIAILAPFGYYTFLALSFPLANDVSTDAFNPPRYISAVSTRDELVAQGGNRVGEYTVSHARKIITAYPKLQPRRYPAGAERVLAAVQTIIIDNEWPVTGSEGIPENQTTGDEELADNGATEQVTEDAGNAQESIEMPDDIYVEFLERTPVLGFENDVIVRIISEDENTLVDVRASSRWGRHDFGYNAKLIERFLKQLDTALLGIAGEG
ncbi:MAG: DUF1499 domain-containing protein [Pseudomonadota bacterium]